MPTDLFRQCRLEKTLPDAMLSTTAWLPEEFAVVGMPLRLREGRQAPWVAGWKVVWISQQPSSLQHLPDHRRDRCRNNYTLDEEGW